MVHRDIRVITAKGKARIPFEEIIIFEDDDLLVVNKPAGISSLAERHEPTGGLLSIARDYYSQLRICHRLDKMTTGALIFAKNHNAFRHVALQFQRRKVEKHYHTLVNGTHLFEAVAIKVPLAPGPRNTVRIDRLEGKKALTWVNTVTRFRHYSLLDCQPITGRPHQIRVHLASVRAPIVGDILYGGANLYLSQLKRRYKSTQEEERPLNDEFLLHARSLLFTHPQTNEPITVIAPYPENFSICLKILEKHDALLL